jgi:hypothetical protein
MTVGRDRPALAPRGGHDPAEQGFVELQVARTAPRREHAPRRHHLDPIAPALDLLGDLSLDLVRRADDTAPEGAVAVRGREGSSAAEKPRAEALARVDPGAQVVLVEGTTAAVAGRGDAVGQHRARAFAHRPDPLRRRDGELLGGCRETRVELEMDVGVDQSGDQHAVRQIERRRRWAQGERFVAPCEDPSVADSQRDRVRRERIVIGIPDPRSDHQNIVRFQSVDSNSSEGRGPGRCARFDLGHSPPAAEPSMRAAALRIRRPPVENLAGLSHATATQPGNDRDKQEGRLRRCRTRTKCWSSPPRSRLTSRTRGT